MEIHFTPEQEALIAEVAGRAGLAPATFVQEATMRFMGEESNLVKLCPECHHRFRGQGWDGIDAHWRAHHEDIIPYEEAWPLIQSGQYLTRKLEDIEDMRDIESRISELRSGAAATVPLDEVEQRLGLGN